MAKMIRVQIGPVVRETARAWQVIYLHLENERDFIVCWLPKSQCTIEGRTATIPMWLKNKISESRKYSGRQFVNEFGEPEYAYGFGPYYRADGREVDGTLW